MDDPQSQAIAYLAVRGDVPWRWADDGDVVVWADGTTIAFRAEVAFVLEWLVPHGWPPFGSLIWVLAACRGKLPPSVSKTDHKADSGVPKPSASLTFHDHIRVAYGVVEDGLAGVSRLPPGLRSSLPAKAILAEVIFGGRQADGPDGSSARSAMVEVLRSGTLTDTMLNAPGGPQPEARNELLSLYEGLKDLDPDTLAMRLRTGIDDLPGAAELPPVASERVRALLAELREDAEHAGLARLARDFMAALQLPRRLSEPDEMPIGGFADIANRGSLDRLLLSELAHDDLTLAVRIALNEALYLRREPPVKQPPCTLTLLLDSGVRMWGVPRVLATAAALALIAKSARHEELVAFRTGGDELVPVDFLTRQGLVDQLGALEPDAHPGPWLDSLASVLEGQERSEAVLITHRDVLADPEFQRQLAQAKIPMLYLAVVDRDGSFELLRHPQGGPPICRAQLEIDDLLPSSARGGATPQRKGKLIDRTAHPELPLALTLDPFPLLIAVRGKVQASVNTSGSAGICVMEDRRLLQWDDPRRGARTLGWSLPRGRTLWLGQLADGRVCVIKAQGGCRNLACRIFQGGGELVGSYDWRFTQPVRRVHVQKDIVFVLGLLETVVHSLVTGEKLGSLETRQGPSHGIYFRGEGGQWTILAWNGLAIEHVPVLLPLGVPGDRVLRVFSRQGFEGPWCLTRDGDIYSHEGQVVLRMGPLQNVVRVSENGHRLLVAEADARVTRLIDLMTRSHRVITGIVRDDQWDWRPVPPTHDIRVKFDAIAIGTDGGLYLRGRSGAWWILDCMTDVNGSQTLDWLKLDSAAVDGIAFQQTVVPGEVGFGLKVASWPDGRCAWLDNRGMLHLRCANRALPEVTVTLSKRAAAWSSDGLVWGPDFFVGGQKQSPSAELWKRIDAFCQPAPIFPAVR